MAIAQCKNKTLIKTAIAIVVLVLHFDLFSSLNNIQSQIFDYPAFISLERWEEMHNLVDTIKKD